MLDDICLYGIQATSAHREGFVEGPLALAKRNVARLRSNWPAADASNAYSTHRRTSPGAHASGG